MNITDVEDKIIRNAAAGNKSIGEYTDKYTQAFLEDSAALRLERPERLVRATENIADMAAARSGGLRGRPYVHKRRFGLLPHLEIPGVRQTLA